MRNRAVALILASTVAACQNSPQHTAITFVHATDLHLFAEPGGDIAPAGQEYQATLNRQAFTALLKLFASARDLDQLPRFLVITGDLGLDASGAGPTASAREHRRQEQIDSLARLFRTSPIPDIYIVAGNNDIEGESASDSAL